MVDNFFTEQNVDKYIDKLPFTSEADKQIHRDLLLNRTLYLDTLAPTYSRKVADSETLKYLEKNESILEFTNKMITYLDNNDRSLFDALDSTQQKFILQILQELADKGYSESLHNLWEVDYIRPQVSPEEFLLSDEYIGEVGKNLYEALRPEFYTICGSDVIQEVIFTGSIGWGKSFMAVILCAWELYKLSCLRNPHAFYGKSENTPIVLMNMALRVNVARAVIFAELKSLCDSTHYFKEIYPRIKKINDSIVFPNKVIFTPGGSSEANALGQNLFSSVIDEMNFMAVTHNSSKSIDASGVYDQAEQIYTTISRRMVNRFSRKGVAPGKLILVSSKRLPTDFIERHMKERKGDPKLYVVSKTSWEVKPKGTHMEEVFYLVLGNETTNSQIVKSEVELMALKVQGKAGNHITVPLDLLPSFERDLEGSLRDLAGIASYSSNPFISNRKLIYECSSDENRLPMFNKWYTNFDDGFEVLTTNIHVSKLLNGMQVKEIKYFPDALRYVAIDLSVSGDRTGISMGCCIGHKELETIASNAQLIKTYKPIIWIDFCMKIYPDATGQVNYSKITNFIENLRLLGYPIVQIGMDSFQSIYHKQLFSQKGFIQVDNSSARDTAPFDALRDAIYDLRINIPVTEDIKVGNGIIYGAQSELVYLEKTEPGKPPDHPPNGQKDISDTLAGVVHQIQQVHGTPDSVDRVLRSGDEITRIIENINPNNEFDILDAKMQIDDLVAEDPMLQLMHKMNIGNRDSFF